jgi:holin-like protein
MQWKKALRIFLQVMGLCLFNEMMSYLVEQLQIPFPSNVLGLMVMAILLVTGVVPLKWVADGADFLLKFLSIFFVPVGVAMMNYWDLIRINGGLLCFVLILTSLFSITATIFPAVLWGKWKSSIRPSEEGREVRANAS